MEAAGAALDEIKKGTGLLTQRGETFHVLTRGIRGGRRGRTQ